MPAKGQECFPQADSYNDQGQNAPPQGVAVLLLSLCFEGYRRQAGGRDNAMQPVVFIARLVGPLFVVLGVGILLNQQIYTDMVGQAVLVPVLIYLSGVMAFLGGVAILNGYHAWTADWRVIVTILGWVLVIGGILRIVFPALVAALAVTVYSGTTSLVIVGVIVLLIGAFLSFRAYWAPGK